MPIFDPVIFDPAIFDTEGGGPPPFVSPATGPPAFPYRLFHGEVTARGATRDRRGYLRLSLEVTDLNRHFPLRKIGAVDLDGLTSTLPDGTLSIQNGAEYNFSDGGGDGGAARYIANNYLPLVLDKTTHVHNTNPDYSGLPVIRWAYTDARAVLDDIAARNGPYIRYRVDQDQALWWTTMAPTGTVSEFSVPAPYDLTGDLNEGGARVHANITGGVELGRIRRRVFVRGGTPLANKWVEDLSAPTHAGEEYIDAPGAVTAADAEAIGRWHLQNRMRPLYSGTAVVRPGFDGFRCLQTVYISDTVLSRDTGFVFLNTPTTIQHVSGVFKAPDEAGSGLTILGLNTGMDQILPNRIAWKALTFAESISGPEKATIVIELHDPDEVFEVADLAFVTIDTDGTAAIEYTIQWGDQPAGSLVRQAAQFAYVPEPVPPTPALRFLIEIVNPGIGVGVPTVVKAQTAEQSGKPKVVPEVPFVWVLEQWSDEAMTIPGDGYSLSETEGVTDIAGSAFAVLNLAEGDAIHYQIAAYALEIPEPS